MTKTVASLLMAGWLAQLLAGKDADVEGGIEAYEAGEPEEALDRYDSALGRLDGAQHPELHLDRGLALLALDRADEARLEFQRASVADDAEVRASGFYQLGNLALDAEDWEGAIGAYISCLKARPDHDSAKWNLEIALAKREEQKKEEEDKEEDEEEEEDEEDEDEDEEDEEEEQGSDDGSEESGEPPGSGDEQEDPEQQDSDTDGEEPPQDEQDEQDDQGQDEGEDQEQEQEQEDGPQQDDASSEQDPNEGENEEGGADAGEEDEPPPDDGSDQESQSPSQPGEVAPLDQMDIDKALEELDAQDGFVLDRPVGRTRRPKQDW